MSETEQGATLVELLLREPEVVAWLDDRRPGQVEPAEEDEGDESPPPAA